MKVEAALCNKGREKDTSWLVWKQKLKKGNGVTEEGLINSNKHVGWYQKGMSRKSVGFLHGTLFLRKAYYFWNAWSLRCNVYTWDSFLQNHKWIVIFLEALTNALLRATGPLWWKSPVLNTWFHYSTFMRNCVFHCLPPCAIWFHCCHNISAFGGLPHARSAVFCPRAAGAGDACCDLWQGAFLGEKRTLPVQACR